MKYFALIFCALLIHCGQDNDNSSKSSKKGDPAGDQKAIKGAVDIPELGFHFSIPSSWEGTGESPTMLSLSHQKSPNAKMLVAYEPRASKEQIQQLLSSPLTIEQGVTITPKGEVASEDSKYSNQFSSPRVEGSLMIAHRSDTGDALVVALLAEPKSYGDLEADYKKLLASLKVTEPLVDSANHQFLAQGTWQKTDQSTDASYDHSYASEEQTTIKLCQNRYEYTSKSQSFFSAPGAGSASNEKVESSSGQWEVYGKGADVLLIAIDEEKGTHMSTRLQLDQGTARFSHDGIVFTLTSPGC